MQHHILAKTQSNPHWMLEYHSKSTPPVTGHSLPVKIIHSIFDISDYCSFLCVDLQLFPLVILLPLDPHRIYLLPLPGIEISRQGSYTSSSILPPKQHPSSLCQGFRALPSLLPCQWTSANWPHSQCGTQSCRQNLGLAPTSSEQQGQLSEPEVLKDHPRKFSSSTLQMRPKAIDMQ